MPADDYEFALIRVNQLAERRQTVTTTYLSVNTALTGAVAFLFKDGMLSGTAQRVSVLMLLLAGIFACGLWRRLITHYSMLTDWWYTQLREMEEILPTSRKLVTKEYQDLFVNKQGKGPIGISRYETLLTWLFTGIDIVFGFAILVALILSFIQGGI